MEGLGLNGRRRTGGAVLGAEGLGLERGNESARAPGAREINSKSLADLSLTKVFPTYNKCLTSVPELKGYKSHETIS